MVSKESPRPAVSTTRKIWKKNYKKQLWDDKQNRALFFDHPVEILSKTIVTKPEKTIAIKNHSTQVTSIHSKLDLWIPWTYNSGADLEFEWSAS